MSRHECPTVGAELLAAVSAALAVVKAHLSDPDPKVALRAASELTKLLAVCARNGIELGTGAEANEDLTPRPPRRPGEGVFKPETRPETPPAVPVTTAPHLDVRTTPVSPLNTPSPGRRGGRGVRSPEPMPAGKPGLTSFLGRADPVSQPPRPAARPLALPD